MYVSPSEDLSLARIAGAHFSDSIQLMAAAFTPRASPGGEVAVELLWRATTGPDRNCNVFVHLYAPDGRLVAQHDAIHDAMPMDELRPTSTWRSGEEISDHHGLSLVLDVPASLQLAVGLYDPASGERLRLNGDRAMGRGVHVLLGQFS